MSVSTNNNGGSIAPNYNNALLQIGINYAMTATAKSGFAFTNWTDGDSNVVTNNPTLRFLMAPGLAFTANFADIAKPTVSITNLSLNPRSGSLVSNEFFTVKGRASDNVAVASVYYILNDATNYLPAATENNWTNWSADLDLKPGANALGVVA